MRFFREIIGVIVVIYPFIVSGGVNQTVKSGIFEFSLTQTEGGCHLLYSSPLSKGKLTLRVIPPCDFHRFPDGRVRIMPTKKGDVMLVESSRPHPNRPKDCYTQVQAVRITKEQIKVSSAISEVAMCLPFQWDDVMFLGLFEKD